MVETLVEMQSDRNLTAPRFQLGGVFWPRRRRRHRGHRGQASGVDEIQDGPRSAIGN